LLPDLVGAVNAHVGVSHALDLRLQPRIALPPGRAQRRIALSRRLSPVRRRGDRQGLADRLDPESTVVFVYERHHDFKRRSSSAWAKYTPASFRVSLERRSSRRPPP
jgi:hypothetical protein